MPTANSGSRAARHASNTSSKSSYKKKTQPPKKKKRLVLKIFLGLLIAGMVAFLAGVGLFWFYARQAPKLEDDKLNATVSSKLYDINNEIFEDLGAEKRE